MGMLLYIIYRSLVVELLDFANEVVCMVSVVLLTAPARISEHDLVQLETHYLCRFLGGALQLRAFEGAVALIGASLSLSWVMSASGAMSMCPSVTVKSSGISMRQSSAHVWQYQPSAPSIVPRAVQPP